MLAEELVAHILTKTLMGWKFQFLLHNCWNGTKNAKVDVISMSKCFENHA
jgi:hypothetical protein